MIVFIVDKWVIWFLFEPIMHYNVPLRIQLVREHSKRAVPRGKWAMLFPFKLYVCKDCPINWCFERTSCASFPFIIAFHSHKLCVFIVGALAIGRFFRKVFFYVFQFAVRFFFIVLRLPTRLPQASQCIVEQRENLVKNRLKLMWT